MCQELVLNNTAIAWAEADCFMGAVDEIGREESWVVYALPLRATILIAISREPSKD